MAYKFLLLLAICIAACGNVNAHLKLHFPMDRVPYTAAEDTNSVYNSAYSEAPAVFNTATRCGTPATSPVSTRLTVPTANQLKAGKVLSIKSTIAVNHEIPVRYGIIGYASNNQNDKTISWDTGALWESKTLTLETLMWRGKNNNDLLISDAVTGQTANGKDNRVIVDPKYHCKNCAMWGYYTNGGTSWYTCSDINIDLPEYRAYIGATADANNNEVLTGKTITGEMYLHLNSEMGSDKGEFIQEIVYQVDNGVESVVTDATNWVMAFNTASVANGQHTLTVTVKHKSATSEEGLDTTVTFDVAFTTENTCPAPVDRICPNGDPSTRGTVPNCQFSACTNPSCSKNKQGFSYDEAGGTPGQPWVCNIGPNPAQRTDFATKQCGPKCTNEDCCIPAENTCGNYQCSGTDMYSKLNPSTIRCGDGTINPMCNDTVCCMPPGVCADEVCQIAAAALSVSTGVTVKQVNKQNSVGKLCAGAECTSTECCVSPASCSSWNCQAGTPKVVSAGLYLSCANEYCTEAECCDEQFTCSQRDCPAQMSRISNHATTQCSAVTCLQEGVCCEPNKTCGDFPCASYGLATPPSQASVPCERQFNANGIGTFVCGVAECCVNASGAGDSAGSSIGGFEDTSLLIGGLLLASIAVGVGGFVLWKRQADGRKSDQTRNMLDGARSAAVQMRPPAQSAAMNTYGNGGAGYV